MNTLVNQVSVKFKVKPLNNESVKFSFGEDDYCLTGGILYAVCDDMYLPGFKKVKSLLQVEYFVAARC